MADNKIYGDLVIKNGGTVLVGTDPVVTENAAQDLTNKTLTNPIIYSPTGLVPLDVGLGNVNNTSDANKPISSATQTALDGKVDENAAITGATKTKISYDAKGLVTAGDDATTDDIQEAAISPINLYFTAARAKAAAVADSITDAITDVAPSQNAVFDALAGKADSSHSHVISDVTGLQGALDDKIETSEKGANNGVATLDAGGKVPASQLPNTVMEFKGVFDPATATFTDAAGNAGDVYLSTAAGSYDAGSGSITYAAGDWAVHNGTIFQKSINSNSVVSVNGQQGVVTLDADDIAEGTNIYFTDLRAQTATISQVITNGVTTKAPSEDAVFDALAGKADSSHVHAISDVTGLSTALSNKVETSLLGAASGVATLGLDSKVTPSQLPAFSTPSAGDINETSFSAADNQSSFANITGLAFANATVRSFEAQVSVTIDATASLYEVFSLKGIQKGAAWDMAVSGVGDDSGYAFQITNAGQIQYTSPAATGFVSSTMKFRASTLSL